MSDIMKSRMIEINGAIGEGGGQVLRSSLSLSLLTGSPCRIQKIRSARSKPGLQRQHYACCLAAAEISGGHISGAELGSSEIEFYPGEPRGGNYTFSIGTAGSTMLLLQTILLPLLGANEPSRIVLEGGTHNPGAPSFDFIDRVFLPVLRRMGARVRATLERPGFFPAGGGRVVVEIEPSSTLEPIEVLERGEIVERIATIRTAKLRRRVAARELEALRQALPWSEECFHIESIEDSVGPGNVILLEVATDTAREITSSYGRLGVPSDRVAKEAVRELRSYLKSDAPVGVHLADQLLLPAVVAGGARIRTLPLSSHTRTQCEVIQEFVEVEIDATQAGGDIWEITLGTGRHESSSSTRARREQTTETEDPS